MIEGIQLGNLKPMQIRSLCFIISSKDKWLVRSLKWRMSGKRMRIMTRGHSNRASNTNIDPKRTPMKGVDIFKRLKTSKVIEGNVQSLKII